MQLLRALYEYDHAHTHPHATPTHTYTYIYCIMFIGVCAATNVCSVCFYYCYAIQYLLF